MNIRATMSALITFFVLVCFVCTADAQAPDKSEKSKPKEQQNVFCAERSTPERFLMVDQVNCETVCNETYKEYACDLKKLLAEGWKVTGVSSGGMTVKKPPCECKITGTETTMEK